MRPSKDIKHTGEGSRYLLYGCVMYRLAKALHETTKKN